MSQHEPDHRTATGRAAVDSPVAFSGPDAPITTFMADEVVMVEPSTSARRAAEVIVDASVGCIVVGSPGKVEGVVSERDIARVVAMGLDPDTTTVADIESTRLVWAGEDADVGAVAREMMEDYVRHVLVGDGERIAGVVSMRDVIAALVT